MFRNWKRELRCVFLCCGWPGHPEKTVKGGTTVSGGSTVLSRILQQSFSTQRRPCRQHTKQRQEQVNKHLLLSQTPCHFHFFLELYTSACSKSCPWLCLYFIMHIWLHRVNRLFCLYHQFLNSPSFVDSKSKVMVTKCNVLLLWRDC